MQTFIRIHPKDSVAVALQPLSNGTVIRLDDLQFTLKEDIPQGHKFALLPISAGEAVIKYGAPPSPPLKRRPKTRPGTTHNPNTQQGGGRLPPYITDARCPHRT